MNAQPVWTLADASHTNLLIELMREFYACEHLRFDDQIAHDALQQIMNNASFGMVHLIGFDQEIVGYVVLTFGFSLEFHGRDALIDELYVRESYRDKGIGRASLVFIEGVCEREGIRALHLEVDRVNTRAQELYRKAGYRDHDRYLLTKWITKP